VPNGPLIRQREVTDLLGINERFLDSFSQHLLYVITPAGSWMYSRGYILALNHFLNATGQELSLETAKSFATTQEAQNLIQAIKDSFKRAWQAMKRGSRIRGVDASVLLGLNQGASSRWNGTKLGYEAGKGFDAEKFFNACVWQSPGKPSGRSN